MIKSIKKESKHTSLSIIDRVIRTIRDIAYNLEYDKITPKRMRYIEFLYNNAPHETLTKYAGQPTSPNDVNNDPELEEFIVRRINQENYNIANSLGFELPNNQKVIVYNERNPFVKRRSQIEPGNYKIIGRKENQYIIEDEFGNQEIKSRVKINPII